MFKVLTEGCTPTRGTKYSACVDLYASEDVVIGAGETKVVGLGVCLDLESFIVNNQDLFMIQDSMFTFDIVYDAFLESHYISLEPRSSLRAKGLQAGTGIIDLDFKDEIKIIIHNPLNLDDAYQSANSIEPEDYKIFKGQRIAQITLLEHKSYLFGIESDVVRDGGLGSTNTAS